MKLRTKFCGAVALFLTLPVLAQSTHHIDVMFDTSGSLRKGRPAVVAAVQTLAWSLMLASDNGQLGSVTLGLDGFCQDVHRIKVGETDVFDVEQWPVAARQLRNIGRNCQGLEDGWRALATVLERRPVRQPGHLLLITDEDRDSVDPDIDQAQLMTTLNRRHLVLDVFARIRLQCADGRPALGMTSAGIGYVMTEAGTFDMCTGATIDFAMGTSVSDYVSLATASGGSVWDVEVLAQTGYKREELQPLIDALAQAYTSTVLNRSRWASTASSFMARPEVATTRVMQGEALELNAMASVGSRPDLGIYEWQWDVDGNGSPDYYGPSAFHIFQSPGYRKVTLTVIDNERNRDTSVLWIDVSNP